jgi:hypothetical protein
MPAWAGKWKGGRYYLDDGGRRVFVLESNRVGIPRSLQLRTHDEDLANSQLVHFRRDPAGFLRTLEPAPAPEIPGAIHITKDRINLYLASIADRARDYYTAKSRDLHAWSAWRDSEGRPIDLRTVTKQTLRVALGSFRGDPKDKRRTGGFKRRAESLNCFANFLVKEGELQIWSALTILPAQRPKETRAERVASTPEEIGPRGSGSRTRRCATSCTCAPRPACTTRRSSSWSAPSSTPGRSRTRA